MSLGGNVTKSLIVFLSGILTARFLGAEDFGRFSFLLGSFMIINELTDIGVNKIFFTKISAQKQSLTLWRLFLCWTLFRIIFLFILILVIFPESFIYQLWKDSPKKLILIAFLASFFNHELWKILSNIGESVRKTYLAQIFNIFIAVTHLIAIISLHSLNELNIKIIFYMIILEYAIGSFLFIKIIGYGQPLSNQHIASIKQEFLSISKTVGPLIIYTWIVFIYQFFDKWFLYKISGNEQTGFFSVSERLSMVSMLFTTALASILWKEISQAYHEKDMERVRQLYSSSFKFLYLVAVTISSILLPHTKFIINMFLGANYIKADFALKCMLLNPIQLSLAYCLGTLLYATSHTKTISMNSFYFIVIGMPFAYFLIAPNNYLLPGLNLGALGLALKLVITNFIVINLLNVSTRKLLKTKLHLFFQFFIPCLLFSCSYSMYYLSTYLGFSGYARFAFSNITYIITLAIIIFYFQKPLLGEYTSEVIKVKLNQLKKLK